MGSAIYLTRLAVGAYKHLFVYAMVIIAASWSALKRKSLRYESCLVKYRTSEWSMPAIRSSVLKAMGSTSVVCEFAPFILRGAVEDEMSTVWPIYRYRKRRRL